MDEKRRKELIAKFKEATKALSRLADAFVPRWHNMHKYRICKKCKIHHYENCGSCFGFGVYSVPDRPGEVFPVTAGEAIETKKFRGKVNACPECGSTVLGLPNASH